MEQEPGLADLTALLYQHLDVLHNLLGCVTTMKSDCDESAVAKSIEWVAQAPFVTSSREDAGSSLSLSLSLCVCVCVCVCVSSLAPSGTRWHPLALSDSI